MNRTRKPALWSVAGTLAAGLIAIPAATPAQQIGYYEEEVFGPGEYTYDEASDLEYQPDEGVHQEEWYDPSDWFDTQNQGVTVEDRFDRGYPYERGDRVVPDTRRTNRDFARDNRRAMDRSEYEYQADEGMHREEWYDPSDWGNYREDGTEYENAAWYNRNYGYGDYPDRMDRSDYEYQAGEGVHREEWYDPSDWMNYRQDGVEYENAAWTNYGAYDPYYDDWEYDYEFDDSYLYDDYNYPYDAAYMGNRDRGRTMTNNYRYGDYDRNAYQGVRDAGYTGMDYGWYFNDATDEWEYGWNTDYYTTDWYDEEPVFDEWYDGTGTDR